MEPTTFSDLVKGTSMGNVFARETLMTLLQRTQCNDLCASDILQLSWAYQTTIRGCPDIVSNLKRAIGQSQDVRRITFTILQTALVHEKDVRVLTEVYSDALKSLWEDNFLRIEMLVTKHSNYDNVQNILDIIVPHDKNPKMYASMFEEAMYLNNTRFASTMLSQGDHSVTERSSTNTISFAVATLEGKAIMKNFGYVPSDEELSSLAIKKQGQPIMYMFRDVATESTVIYTCIKWNFNLQPVKNLFFVVRPVIQHLGVYDYYVGYIANLALIWARETPNKREAGNQLLAFVRAVQVSHRSDLFSVAFKHWMLNNVGCLWYERLHGSQKVSMAELRNTTVCSITFDPFPTTHQFSGYACRECRTLFSVAGLEAAEHELMLTNPHTHKSLACPMCRQTKWFEHVSVDPTAADSVAVCQASHAAHDA